MKCIKILSILLVGWLLTRPDSVNCDNRILVYLRHAPPDIINQALNTAKKENLLNDLQNSNNFEALKLKNQYKKLLTPHLSGFSAIYGGYIDISNKDGIIQFPLRQTSKKLYIAFTEKIKLVRIKNNTISHRKFANPVKCKTALYLYEKKTDEKNNNFWNVTEAQIPQDLKIDPLTIVIFTNPSNVFVRTGDFMSNDSQHFVIPDIYVIDTLNQAITTLNILKVKRFFEPVKLEEKTATEKSTQGLLNNT